MVPTRRPARKPAPQAADERLFVEAAQSDRATAEDLTSEVFHKALANLPRYEWRGVPFAAWLLRIAANAIADQFKRTAREFPSPDDPPEAPAGRDLQASELRAIEHHAQLFHLVGQLPESQKRVVYERFVEQRSIREIAKRLGKTPGAIKQLQLRAVQNLRAQMEGGHG